MTQNLLIVESGIPYSTDWNGAFYVFLKINNGLTILNSAMT